MADDINQTEAKESWLIIKDYLTKSYPAPPFEIKNAMETLSLFLSQLRKIGRPPKNG